ncbi:BES1/BZR1 plant transcription factor, N-terminal [Dillenia turbinata]|uniref:Multifunctional fusion protein n=1 Tax=Dillenia turbinata TaxID=194707 RepID=A0AAN8VIA2_9MAGN
MSAILSPFSRLRHHGFSSPSSSPVVAEKELEKEKGRTKLRERHRCAITSRMLAGLHQNGSFPLPARADMNEVLAALAREAGWTVDPDGTTCRPSPPPHSQLATYPFRSVESPLSANCLKHCPVKASLDCQPSGIDESLLPASLNSVVATDRDMKSERYTSGGPLFHLNALMLISMQLMQDVRAGEQGNDFRGTPYIPVYIPAVFWWYRTSSHAAELMAGYHNPTNQDGYSAVFEILKKHCVTIKFICSGPQVSCPDDEAYADPEGLSWQEPSPLVQRTICFSDLGFFIKSMHGKEITEAPKGGNLGKISVKGKEKITRADEKRGLGLWGKRAVESPITNLKLSTQHPTNSAHFMAREEARTTHAYGDRPSLPLLIKNGDDGLELEEEGTSIRNTDLDPRDFERDRMSGLEFSLSCLDSGWNLLDEAFRQVVQRKLEQEGKKKGESPWAPGLLSLPGPSGKVDVKPSLTRS